MKKLILIAAIIFLFGCSHVVSKELRESVDKDVGEAALFKDPAAYKGKTVMLGGIIVSSSTTSEGSYIEVLEKPLNSRGEPKDTDISHGRFIIFYEGYLDTEIYSMGRRITVVGEVLGKSLRSLGEIQYPYVLIKSKEHYLIGHRRDIPIKFGLGIMHTF